MPSFFSIELLHLRSRRCLTFLGVRRGYAVGKIPLLYFELKATAFVITHYFAQLRVFLRECKEPVFEAGVVCDDRSPIVSFIKIYLGRFMRFLNACNHIFQNLLFFRSVRSTPVFCSQKPRSSSALFAIFPTVWLSLCNASFATLKINKTHILSVYTLKTYFCKILHCRHCSD